MPVITKLEAQKHDPERVNVFVDGAFAIGLSASVVLARGLHQGAEITRQDLEAYASDDLLERSYGAALNFLSYRPRSTRELRDYFRRRKADPELAEAVIERLQTSGLLNDGEFARFWVENRQTFRPRGTRALRMEMRQKGLSNDVIDEALEEIGDEQETAYEVARQKARSYAANDEREFFRRMVGFLQRRGFPYEAASTAARRVFAELTGEPATLGED